MDKNTWIETASGNRISRRASIRGAQNIALAGYSTICPGAELEASVFMVKNEEDASISMGKYCFLDCDAAIYPPAVGTRSTGSKPVKVYSKVKIGSYVMVGSSSIVRSEAVGSRVRIGKDCMLGSMSTVSDVCVIEDGVRLPERMVVAPYSRVRVVDGTLEVTELAHGYRKGLERLAREAYIAGAVGEA